VWLQWRCIKFLKGLDHKQKLTSFRTSQVIPFSNDLSGEGCWFDWMLCDFNDASFPLPVCENRLSTGAIALVKQKKQTFTDQ
jgi:hypothetical protein